MAKPIHPQVMRKLIRNRATQLFLANEEGWTDDLMQAREVSYFEAIQAASELGPQDVELYFSFRMDGESPQDFASSIPPVLYRGRDGHSPTSSKQVQMG